MEDAQNSQVIKEMFLRAIEGKTKKQKRSRRKLQELALGSANGFIAVLNCGAKLMEGRPKECTEIIAEIVEKAPRTIIETGGQKVIEAVARMFAVLATMQKREDTVLFSLLERFISGFQLSGIEELFFVFPNGPQGQMIPYPIIKGQEDKVIFKILSNMKGLEYALTLMPESAETIFASVEDLERCLRLPMEEQLRIQERAENLVALAREAWQEIKGWRRYGIRSEGRDVVAIVEKDPIKKLKINYLRFIQEAANPPAVGVEVILDNKRIILAKLDQNGNLLVPWGNHYPAAALLLNVAIVLYLRDLTCGKEDAFVRLRRVKRSEGEESSSSPREPKECLLPRPEIEYIPHRHLSRYLPLSGNDEMVRKVSWKPREISYRREHRRRLPLGWRPSERALKKAEAKGYNLRPGETFVREFIREDMPGKQTDPRPERILRDRWAARELSRALSG